MVAGRFCAAGGGLSGLMRKAGRVEVMALRGASLSGRAAASRASLPQPAARLANRKATRAEFGRCLGLRARGSRGREILPNSYLLWPPCGGIHLAPKKRSRRWIPPHGGRPRGGVKELPVRSVC